MVDQGCTMAQSTDDCFFGTFPYLGPATVALLFVLQLIKLDR